MGGRIYDAHLGRFLQADPFVQAPSNSQNHNRYSYVLNNPLSYTDPSGYFFSKLWKEIKPFIGVIVAVVGTIVCPACGPVLIGALAGAANAAVNGGNILQGAVMGAFSGMMFGVVGETWAAGTFGNVLGNAAVGGWMNSIQGGKFGHGFFAAGFSAAFKTSINDIGNKAASHAAHRIVAAAIVGGAASKISGGKFANGAVTGAFSQAFNGERTNRRDLVKDRVTITTSSDAETNHHEYRISGMICETTSTGCDNSYADKIYNDVNANDVPLTSNDLKNGDHILGPLRDPIRHEEYPALRMSVNVALDGHTFYPGTVTHRVYFSGGALYYDIVGVGNARFHNFNNNVGMALFSPSVKRIVWKYGI